MPFQVSFNLSQNYKGSLRNVTRQVCPLVATCPGGTHTQIVATLVLTFTLKTGIHFIHLPHK